MVRHDEPRYEDVTWTTGIPVSRENASQIYSRYRFAADLAQGRRVLELGCGAGQGFGLLEERALNLVGGDYSCALLSSAHRHYGSRVPLLRLSAESLPFADGSFDLVVFFEASYYVPDMEQAFDEIRRVLAPGGEVFFSNHNPEHPNFLRSPHSHHYHSASEFRAALATRGFVVRTFGVFPSDDARTGASRVAGRVLSFARIVLERLHLVPRTLRGRAVLKRIVYGRLVTLPPELFDGFAPFEPPQTIEDAAARRFRAIYVLGSLT